MTKDENQAPLVGIKEEIASALNVTTISTDPLITDIFHYPYWSALEGLLFLAGIFKEYRDGDGVMHLITLNNMDYSKTSNKDIYDAFIERYNRFERIWDHANKLEKYRRSFFIKWALQYQNLCEITWLNDAQEKGFVSEDILKKKLKESIGTKELTTLLIIIAALAKEAKMDITKPSKIAELIEDLTVSLGSRVSKRTIENYLNKIPDALERRCK